MVDPEQEGLLDDIQEPKPEELAQPSELQGGAVAEEAALAHIDTFLNRLFRVGELIPWKKCWFQVIGVRGGVVGLALKSVPEVPRARHNHGVRPSRAKKKAPKTLVRRKPVEPKQPPAIEGPVQTFEGK